METQVPLFDLGASNEDEIKIVWQSSDGNGNTDLADNIVSLKGESSSISEAISSLVNDSNTVNEGQGVVIDGYFGDWSDINKQFDVISNAESEHVDLKQYAAVNQDEHTFMYMSVEGNMLNGISIPAALNASHRPSMISPLVLVTPFSASSIQYLRTKLRELSPNSMRWQTGFGSSTTRLAFAATSMAICLT